MIDSCDLWLPVTEIIKTAKIGFSLLSRQRHDSWRSTAYSKCLVVEKTIKQSSYAGLLRSFVFAHTNCRKDNRYTMLVRGIYTIVETTRENAFRRSFECQLVVSPCSYGAKIYIVLICPGLYLEWPIKFD